LFLSWALQNEGTLYPIFFDQKITRDKSILNPSLSISNEGIATIVFRGTDYKYIRPASNLDYFTESGSIEYIKPRKHFPYIPFFFAIHDFSKKIDGTSVSPIEIKKIYSPVFDDNFTIHYSSIEDLRICRVNKKLTLIGNIQWRGKMRRSVYFDIQEIHPNISQVIIENLEIMNSEGLSSIEKNWVPIEDVSDTFVRWPNPTELFLKSSVDEKTSVTNFPQFKRELFGGSPLVIFQNGYLSIAHSRVSAQKFNNHRYMHTLIFYNKKFEIEYMSKPFTFMGYETEFCSGISVYSDKVFLSYSCNDSLNFIISINSSTILNLDN